jgi:UrcA family protein
MKTASRYTLLALFVGSLTAFAGAGAHADEPTQRTVRYADLDLSQSAGVEQLYTRIKAAARGVCEPVSIRDLQSVAAANHCMEQAIAHSIAKVDAPALTNYYLAKTGKSMSVARQ